MKKDYQEFLKSKVVIAESYGIDASAVEFNPKLFPHQRDIVNFCLEGGRRAIFASFGLGKSIMQLEIARILIKRTDRPFLIVCPLGVSGEFKRDNSKLGTGLEITYITDTDDFDSKVKAQIYLTNYERVRKGDIDASLFCGVSFDEASILRNLQTQTTNYVLHHFKKVPYRFVATATPTPNDYIEILNYADYLGVISRGHALTRFFQRDSTKAGNLKLYENKKEEFWQWVSTWAAFINTPDDLGYDGSEYVLPKLNLIEHRISYNLSDQPVDKWGTPILFRDLSKSLLEVSREKRESMPARVNCVGDIMKIFTTECGESNDGREKGVSERVLREEPGSVADKTAHQKQRKLRKEQGSVFGKESSLGGIESGKNEDASIATPQDVTVEEIPTRTLSEECSEKQRSIESEQTKKSIWNNRGAIRGDVEETGRPMQDMRSNQCGSISEEEGESIDRSLPQNGNSPRSTVPSLQCGTRTVSRRSGDFAESNRLSRQILIWCDLNSEQVAIERLLKANNVSFVSITGGETSASRESKMEQWRDGDVDVFVSKTSMYGAGINMQQASDMIFVGITYKFQDYIQGIHRCYRFGQKRDVNVHIIYTENEGEVLKALKAKWQKHIELNNQMIALVREYGLNSNLIKSQMQRQLFQGGRKFIDENVILYNNDCVTSMDDIPDNSVHMVLTSIPFGDHYEYSENYNDFGHNHGNENFFRQMDFLTPKLLRALKPGRIAAIHVKDRIRYSYQNGTSFTTISDFSGQTVQHFQKHGFYLLGKITITTDVVAENNQTYRLGWTEQCKDSTKMGVGLPEYVLLFRKAPTTADNSYADEPVQHTKDEYTKALWQLDAHAYHRSNGDRFLTSEELQRLDVRHICSAWKRRNETEIYSFAEHLRICEELDEQEKLSSTFMTLPVHSNSEMVWTDVNRMNTLNLRQVSEKREKHICCLQLDIIERLINRYTMPGEIVLDPFGGLFSVPYKALEMGRKAIGIELNSQYFTDGLFYVKAMQYKLRVPTLFDILESKVA